MEATKKKKAYLKPEMSAFEVKTQEFIAGSRVEIGEIVIVPDVDAGNNSCLPGGTWSEIKNGNNYNTGKCVYTQFQSNTGDNASDFLKAGFQVGDCLVMKVIEQDANGGVKLKALRVDCANNNYGSLPSAVTPCPEGL